MRVERALRRGAAFDMRDAGSRGRVVAPQRVEGAELEIAEPGQRLTCPRTARDQGLLRLRQVVLVHQPQRARQGAHRSGLSDSSRIVRLRQRRQRNREGVAGAVAQALAVIAELGVGAGGGAEVAGEDGIGPGGQALSKHPIETGFDGRIVDEWR